MKLNIPQGKYVVAVSGGVDSMVLLDLLANDLAEHTLLVAHYQHNLRSNKQTAADLEVIEDYCERHNLRLVVGSYDGGQDSEAALREARYMFLNDQLARNDYNSVITAHHKDDLIETAIINLLRGTKWAGLHPIVNSGQLLRPLLEYSKDDILKYASKHKISWHEDETNEDERYLRNYVRGKIIPKLEKRRLIDEFYQMIQNQKSVDEELATLMQLVSGEKQKMSDSEISIDRSYFISLPHEVAKLVLLDIIEKLNADVEVDTSRLEKAVVFAKTGSRASSIDLSKDVRLSIERDLIKIGL